MQKHGWVWEGIGFDPGVEPTVYGVGEGITYFGVDGANLIFHRNNRTNLAKLAHAPKVTAEISKWIWYETKAETGRFTFAQTRDDSPENVMLEAQKLSRLSADFTNVVGGYIDDTHGIMKHSSYNRKTPAKIKEALRSENDKLDLWIVVYTHEFGEEFWKDWIDAVDVISLWVWESRNLPNVEKYVKECRSVFPKSRIDMGVYIRDYSIPAAVPLDMMETELKAIAKGLQEGWLDGYSILGNCLIDQHPEQAEFIRDFLRNA